MLELREARIYGVRELRSFRAAATKYLHDYHFEKSIDDGALHVKQLDPFIRIGRRHGSGRRVCRSRIARTCWVIVVAASRLGARLGESRRAK